MTTPVSRRTLLTGTGAAVTLGLLQPPASAWAKPSKGLDEIALQRAINSMVTEPVVGVVASIVGPKGTFNTAAGLRDLTTRVAAKPNNRSYFASVTKAMVATVAMQLIEEGRLTLDTTIDQVLPGLYPGHGDVPLRQLLNHTSGMPDAIWQILGKGLYELTAEEVIAATSTHYSQADLVAISRQMPWAFEPGTNSVYSNTGYVVIGMMLEKITGQRLPQLIRTRVFKPAKMAHARIADSSLVRGTVLTSYLSWPDGSRTELDELDSSIFWGAGALCGTAEDVTDFYGALMTGRLVSQASVDQMVTPEGYAVNTGYGFGIWSIADPCTGEPLYGHDGGGFGSISLALSTRDGSRRLAYSWTGRPYGDPAWADAVWPPEFDVLTACFKSTCPSSDAVASKLHKNRPLG